MVPPVRSAARVAPARRAVRQRIGRVKPRALLPRAPVEGVAADAAVAPPALVHLQQVLRRSRSGACSTMAFLHFALSCTLHVLILHFEFCILNFDKGAS